MTLSNKNVRACVEARQKKVAKAYYEKKAYDWNTYECESCGTELRGPAWKECPVCRAPSSRVKDTGKSWDKEHKIA